MTAALLSSTPKSPPVNQDGRLRVLFLPKNSRVPYFRSLLRYAREGRDWQIQVVCAPGSEPTWRDSVGAQAPMSIVPDFTSPASWEADSAAVDEIDEFIRTCETAAGIPAGRIILAGERDLGRGFSLPIYNWFHTRMARMTLADNRAALPIIRRMFSFARETLESARPDLVIAGEWADPMCFVFRLAAQTMGIRCVVNRQSKLWSGRTYWSSSVTMYNDAAFALAARLRDENAPVSSRAQERIRNFRSAPDTLGYVKQSWRASDSKGFFGYYDTLARMFAVELRHVLGRRGGPPPKPAWRVAFQHHQQAWLKWRQQRFFRRLDSGTLADMPYLLIALHKDPEQALNYQAPFWSNQYNTVALLSGSLPAGYRLLVREHRNNSGRRPTRFYEHLSRLPGVILIDGFDDQFKYIANADLVVTDNGSTGWEALMLGRRVITLADTFYDGARLTRRIDRPEYLSQEIVEALQKPAMIDPAAHDCALGWMLDAEWTTTAPADHDVELDHLSAAVADIYENSPGMTAKSA